VGCLVYGHGEKNIKLIFRLVSEYQLLVKPLQKRLKNVSVEQPDHYQFLLSVVDLAFQRLKRLHIVNVNILCFDLSRFDSSFVQSKHFSIFVVFHGLHRSAIELISINIFFPHLLGIATLALN